MWNDKQPPRPIAGRTRAELGLHTQWSKPCCPNCGGLLNASVDEITEDGAGACEPGCAQLLRLSAYYRIRLDHLIASDLCTAPNSVIESLQRSY